MSLALTNLIGFGAVTGEFSCTYIGTTTLTTNLTTYTFSGVSIGAADPTRLVVVGVAAICGAFASVNSGTIDGSAATVVVAAGATRYSPTAILSRVVPSGTTCDITVTLSTTGEHCSIHVWSIVNYGSATATDTDAVNTGPATSVTATLDIPANGTAVYAHAHGDTSATSWTSASEVNDATVETRRHASGQKDVTTALSAHAESASWTTNATGGISGASWGP